MANRSSFNAGSQRIPGRNNAEKKTEEWPTEAKIIYLPKKNKFVNEKMKCTQSNKTEICELPNIILKHILSFVTPNEIKEIMLVCKQMYSLAISNYVLERQEKNLAQILEYEEMYVTSELEKRKPKGEREEYYKYNMILYCYEKKKRKEEENKKLDAIAMYCDTCEITSYNNYCEFCGINIEGKNEFVSPDEDFFIKYKLNTTNKQNNHIDENVENDDDYDYDYENDDENDYDD